MIPAYNMARNTATKIVHPLAGLAVGVGWHHFFPFRFANGAAETGGNWGSAGNGAGLGVYRECGGSGYSLSRIASIIWSPVMPVVSI